MIVQSKDMSQVLFIDREVFVSQLLCSGKGTHATDIDNNQEKKCAVIHHCND